jgi:nucleoside-diphosphate-sugar epimerase
VVHELLEMGHEVRIFHRGHPTSELCQKLTCVHADRTDIVDHAETLWKYAPQVVLDMIPINQADAQAINKVFKGVAERIVGISSQDVYRAYGIILGIEDEPLVPVPLTENSPLRSIRFPYRDQVTPEHPLYSYDKILIEEIYMGDSKLPGTILRLPMVYGPGDYQHRTFPYLKRMDDGRPAIILENGISSWCWTKGYVADIAHAIALAVTDQRAAGRIYNLGEAVTLNQREWVRAIGRAAGWNREIVTFPNHQLPEQLRTKFNVDQQLLTDTSRIRAELDYVELISQEEALHRTIKWERQNPPDVIDPNQFDYQAEDALLEI